MPAPVKKKKKFIDKKHAITFKLVHRSQRDSELPNPEASKYVLEPVKRDRKKVNQLLTHHRERVIKEALLKHHKNTGFDIEEHHKNLLQYKDEPSMGKDLADIEDRFVIYRKDLKSNEETKKGAEVRLPASVFPSEKEEEAVGLLNKAAPLGLDLTLDSDVIAALDDDDGSSLEDYFVMKADRHSSSEDIYSDSSVESYFPITKDMVVPFIGSDDETKEEESCFSNLSLTSAVIRRNEKLKVLDEMFDKVFEQYGNEEIGALDGEDLYAPLNPDSVVMKMLLDEYEKSSKPKEPHDPLTAGASLKEIYYKSSDEEDNGEELANIVIEEFQKEWDCESITSTYSNLYNHPKLIKVEPSKIIKISQKTGIPKDVLQIRGLTTKQVAKLNKDNNNSSPSPASHIRVRGETPDERKVRKKIVKDERRERRLEKKANKLAFKEETKEQAKVLYNLQHNLSNIKLV